MTKKDLLEAIEDMPIDAEVLIHLPIYEYPSITRIEGIEYLERPNKIIIKC